ncbi:uncharacterized protein LOC128180976 [Crassostrea angulata]|uniref:uncharacterized protein LOC128180976 n=1 Tax=Magallana angulata TaxID=2784310 RepID=UPI0022B0EF44|nr:uncharacterized protein LOC128180976 [Crassostrea angulata]
METSSKAFVPIDGTLSREDELVSLFVRKIGILNTRTGRCTLRLSYRDPVALNWATSNDAGDYIVKKSNSDGVIATGSYSHMIARNSFKLADFKDVQNKSDRNNNQHQKPSEDFSLIQNGSTTVEEVSNGNPRKELDLEARAARQKQIEDFFTDPVDREMFPLNPPETQSTRTYRPIEIPTAEESISTMLGKFSAALWDKDFMREVYEYRRLPRPPARGLAPLSYEWLTLNTYSGLMQSIEQETPGDSQEKAGIVQTQDTETVDLSDQLQGSEEFDLCSRDQQKSEHRTSWFVRLFCCGATSSPKKVKQEKETKSKGFLSQVRRVFGRK